MHDEEEESRRRKKKKEEDYKKSLVSPYHKQCSMNVQNVVLSRLFYSVLPDAV